MKVEWTLYNVLMLIAVLLSPLIAVQATRWLDERKASRERKFWVFKRLMATRGMRLSADHVAALNMIDLEFDSDGAGDKAIRSAWHSYLDRLATPQQPDGNPEVWLNNSLDAFARLMVVMAQQLKYKHIDDSAVRNMVYMPKHHGDADTENNTIRRKVAAILDGRDALRVTAVQPPAPVLPERAPQNHG